VKLLRSRTLRSALVELLIVVVGILVAVQIDAWNQTRRDQRTAESYLTRLEVDLRRDSTMLASLSASSLGMMAVADRLLSGLTESSPPDSVGLWIRRARGVSFFEPRVSTYEDMVSAGQSGLIRDVALRDLLFQYHEVANGDWLVAWSNHLRWTHWEEYASYLSIHVDPRSIPIQMVDVRPVEFLTGWEAFRTDPEIRSALLNIWGVSEGSSDNYQRRLGSAIELIQMIRANTETPR
jgi:Family of unknown function (DUF6090)